MYTITKGPSKLVAQRRTGPTQQQVESRLGELLKCRHPVPPTPQPPQPPRAQPPGPWPLSSPGPRLVFNRVNGRRPPAISPSLEGTQETYTLAHEENVRFVSEDFVPIDLDEWWAQQFLARITNCS
ncbi:MAPK regulated corepressor interacting protein 2 isoform X2 [Hippopotamus amphibius kiboko]|uniref:MAPK regulated corepressor interacting protein 2 isoform X2 n=1 Tax=Hippopotamus amphibius kiboko TaxID=575201 RepID=UPI002599CF9B|nr:MAPK regulated corepressor interacting protein 2 isoform X2 [Hippopotamus amphibius kiboko]